MSGRAVGVFQRKPFNRRCMILGEGDVPPPPRQPNPTGRYPIDALPGKSISTA